jgi:hypothetical protein
MFFDQIDWYIVMLQDKLDNDPVFKETILYYTTEELKRLNCILITMPIGNEPPAQRKFMSGAFHDNAEIVVYPNIHEIPKIHKQLLKI